MPSKISAAERNPLAKGCEGCFFLSAYFGCCNYLIYTDKRRPCPGGKDCTVKTTQTPENWEKVLLWDTALAQKLYKQGATDAEIAKACKAPIGQVKAFRSKHLGPANRKAGEGYGGRPIGWDTEKGLQLWMEGKTLAEIAKEVGSSKTAVSHYAARYWAHLKDQRAKREDKPRDWDKETAYRLYCEGGHRSGHCCGGGRSRRDGETTPVEKLGACQLQRAGRMGHREGPGALPEGHEHFTDCPGAGRGPERGGQICTEALEG